MFFYSEARRAGRGVVGSQSALGASRTTIGASSAPSKTKVQKEGRESQSQKGPSPPSPSSQKDSVKGQPEEVASRRFFSSSEILPELRTPGAHRSRSRSRQREGDREILFKGTPPLICERLVVCGTNPLVNGFLGRDLKRTSVDWNRGTCGVGRKVERLGCWYRERG